MFQSAFKGTKAEWREAYEKADKCLYVTDENETISDFQAFDSTVALDDSQSYWRLVMTNVCSEEWFNDFILSESSETTGEPEKSDAEIWSGDLPWSVYNSTEDCTAGKDEGVLFTGSTTSLRLEPDGAHLCEADALNENGTTTTVYSKYEPVSCGSDIYEARVYTNCDADCASCGEETDSIFCKSPILTPCPIYR